MNNQFSLKINTPCTKSVKEFTSTKNGGFCGSCQKEVIDFTKMDSQEIMNYFETKSTQNTCGIFQGGQLITYENTLSKRKSISFIGGLGLAFLSLFSFGKVHAQEINDKTKGLEKEPLKFQSVINKKNIVVKGTVIEEGMPLPGASVVLEGTTIGTSADFDGNFVFPKKLKKGDVLVFSYVGMNSKKVEITSEKSVLNVTLKVNLKMSSCILVGKVAVKKVYSSK